MRLLSPARAILRSAPTLLVGLLAGGCYLSHEAPPEPPAEPPPEPPAEPPTECALPPPADAPPGGDLCGFVDGAPSAHPAPLVFLVGDALLALDGGGDLVELHRFTDARPEAERHLGRGVLAVRGRFAAAGVTRREPGPDDPETAGVELVLLDLEDGRVVARFEEELPYDNWGGGFDLRGSPDGLFVFALRFGDHTRFGVLSEAWTGALPLEGFAVATDPDRHGDVGIRRVRDPDPGGPDQLWVDLCTLERRPMRAGVSHRVVDDRVLGATAEGLLYESASELDVLSEGDHLGRSFRLAPSRVVLSATAETGVYRTHALEGGASRTLRIRIPEGLRRARETSFSRDPTRFDLTATEDANATSAGGILVGFRDDRAAQVFETLDGETWTAVGAPMGQIYDARGYEVGGTYFLFGDAFAVDVGPWPADVPDRLDGHSVQLVRPASGVELVLEQSLPLSYTTRDYRVTADGRCVAWRTPTGVHVVSAVTGARRDVSLEPAPASAGTQLDDLAWAVGSRSVSGP